MAKLTKIVNGEYIGGNKYKITSTGDGKSTIDFSPDTVLTPGTPVGAEVLNEIQKNGLYTLIGTKRVVGQEDIYDCTFEGIENFDFEEINILLKPNANSTMQNVFVNAGGSKYKITSILGTSCNIFANQNIGLTLKKSTLQAIKWDMSDDTKLPKGSLPTTIKSGKDLYDMLENNGGINIDTALLYLNDAGTKTAGKVYFDKNKKGLFECIKTTTNTVNSTEFFVDISNKASSDRLTNLIYFNQPISYKCSQWNNIPYPPGFNSENCLVIPVNYGSDSSKYFSVKINSNKKTFYAAASTTSEINIIIGFTFIKTI